jgi:predicted HAD superfamily Cof-like phosphohydrolase
MVLENTKNVPFVNEVEEFNTTMGKSVSNRYTPTIDPKDADFVINFIQEELDELKEAVKNGDIVEVLDAILDITYVCLGNGAMSFGLKDKITPGYAEVQASNMSKICDTLDDAVETVNVRTKQQGEACHYEELGDKYESLWEQQDSGFNEISNLNKRQDNLTFGAAQFNHIGTLSQGLNIKHHHVLT